MAINFTFYPDSNRVPGVYVEMDPSQANTAQTFQRSLVIGQMTSEGSALPDVPLEVESMAQIMLACGRGSMLAQMAAAYLAGDNFGDVWLLPIADNVAGQMAHGHFKFTGPCTAPGTLNLYTRRAQWFNCNDQTQPGIAAITNYLNALPYKVSTNCGPGQYFQAVNVNPAFTPKGTLQSGLVVPATTQKSIGDVLTANNISWKYYGNGFNVTGTGAPLDGLYCNICNPFEYQANYPSMVPDHMRDVTDLFSDLIHGTLPAVSYVKPDGALDGHPASSKWGLFEAFTKNIIELAQSNPKQWAETAIFVTVDEGGGYYDSGFIQPVDFFGTGPRIPIIAVSPFSRGGHISHVYAEHSSFVKFVERNWRLNTTLSGRSRDNLPNPRLNKDDNPYIPSNMPAIGDIFDLFNFGEGHD